MVMADPFTKEFRLAKTNAKDRVVQIFNLDASSKMYNAR
jgi:hypothetical protein